MKVQIKKKYTKKEQPKAKALKKYAPPKLIAYGRLSDYTAGGSGNAAENSASGSKRP